MYRSYNCTVHLFALFMSAAISTVQDIVIIDEITKY